MKKLSKLALGLALVAATTACGDLDTDTKSTQGFLNSYAVITDLTDDTQTVSSPVTIGLFLNWTTNEAEIAISGLTINGNVYPQMSLLSLVWSTSTDKLWGNIETDVPAVALTTGQFASVTNFNFTWSDRLDMPDLETSGAGYDPALFYSFTLDNRYKVVGSRAPFSFWGDVTTVSDNSDAQPFVTKGQKIIAAPDFKAMTMSVYVNGAKVADAMPGLDIQLNDIPMAFEENGRYITFEVDNLIPSMAGTPVPSRPCSNIKGRIDPKVGMTFQFDCNVPGMGVFTVSTEPTLFGYRN